MLSLSVTRMSMGLMPPAGRGDSHILPNCPLWIPMMHQWSVTVITHEVRNTVRMLSSQHRYIRWEALQTFQDSKWLSWAFASSVVFPLCSTQAIRQQVRHWKLHFDIQLGTLSEIWGRSWEDLLTNTKVSYCSTWMIWCHFLLIAASCNWLNLLDRGGLFHVNEMVYQTIICMEVQHTTAFFFTLTGS